MTDETLDTLQESIKQLESAIVKLKAEAQRYYDTDDNMRGNIRYDAATRLTDDLFRLTVASEYLAKALKK